MKKVKVGIAGGAGYTAGELLRILLYHPHVEIASVLSKSNTGNPVAAVHTDLVGETDLIFTNQLNEDIDVLFLCVGHGESQVFLDKHSLSEKVRIIDLSQDFRIEGPYHDFVYGLPEMNKPKIREAHHIANPGCFATCIQLGFLPLAHARMMQNDLHIHAITGSTGAGQQPTETSHFSWRNNNISVYKAFSHQHLKETRQSLYHLHPGFNHQLYFVPVRGNFTRGIYATLYMKTDAGLDEIKNVYQEFYKNEPFVFITDANPDLKQVVNTNKCLLHLEKHEDVIFIISMIDNLVKGASGQAVQNMNLLFGLEETAGLHLKGSYF